MDCEDTLRDAVLCLIDQFDDGPSWLDYVALLVIPVISATATIFIAFASLRTSRRATEIAAAALQAETNRAEKEHERVQEGWRREYAARLDAHFADLFEAIGQYSAAHDRWIDECGELEIHWHGDPDDIPYPPQPSRAMLDARLQATMLHAREDDRVVLGKIDGYIRAALRSKSAWKLSHRLTSLVESIRKWRDGSCTPGTFVGRLKRKRTTIELDRDIPPRRV